MTRGIWNRETVALLILAALLPIAVAWLIAGGTGAAARLVLVLLVVAVWQVIWMFGRALAPSWAGVATALGIAMLAPVDLGPAALLLATSFGVVAAELAFGGWGRNVVNPGAVTLVFLGFGFPVAGWPELAVQLGWAAIASALLGVAFGVMSWRLFVGAGAALAATHLAGINLSAGFAPIAVVLVVLVADPVVNAATHAGRYLVGGLYGGLIALFLLYWQEAAPAQIAVSAALLSSLSAPLIDEIAIAIWLARRRQRHG